MDWTLASGLSTEQKEKGEKEKNQHKEEQNLIEIEQKEKGEKEKNQQKEEQNLIEIEQKEKGENEKGIKRPQLSQGLKVSPEKKIRLNSTSPDSGIGLEDIPRLASIEKNTQALEGNFPRPVWTTTNIQALKKSLLQVAGIKNSFPLNFDRLKYFPDLKKLDREGKWCRDDPLNSPFPGEYSPVPVSGHPVSEASEVSGKSGGQEERSAIRQQPQEANNEFNTDKPEPLGPLASPRPSLSEISSYYHMPTLLSPITDPLPPESQHQENRDNGGHRERPSLLVKFPLRKLNMSRF